MCIKRSHAGDCAHLTERSNSKTCQNLTKLSPSQTLSDWLHFVRIRQIQPITANRFIKRFVGKKLLGTCENTDGIMIRKKTCQNADIRIYNEISIFNEIKEEIIRPCAVTLVMLTVWDLATQWRVFRAVDQLISSDTYQNTMTHMISRR
jgi:hypothetical protein